MAYKEVTFSRYRPGVAQRVGRGIALLFHDRGTRRGWVASSTPLPHFIPGKTRYPFYRRLGGPQSRSGRAENLVPTGIRSRTVQSVVSHYTDWATRPTEWHIRGKTIPAVMDRPSGFQEFEARWKSRQSAPRRPLLPLPTRYPWYSNELTPGP